jgi:hypothetical protein
MGWLSVVLAFIVFFFNVYWCSLFNCLLQDSRNLPYYLKMSYYKLIILQKSSGALKLLYYDVYQYSSFKALDESSRNRFILNLLFSEAETAQCPKAKARIRSIGWWGKLIWKFESSLELLCYKHYNTVFSLKNREKSILAIQLLS